MDNNLFYETDIKIRFDNSNHKNDFLGVAGDSETRKLSFSVFDSEGAPVLTDFPELKLLDPRRFYLLNTSNFFRIECGN